MKILITTPSLRYPGGVASFYNSILQHLYTYEDLSISILEIGRSYTKFKFLHPILDQLRFIKKLLFGKFDIVHINPSLKLKSFIRDGLFIFWAKINKVPVIVFIHGWDESFCHKIAGLLYFFFKQTYNRSDCFILLANDFKLELIKKGIKQPIHLLSTAVDDSLSKNFFLYSKINHINSINIIKILFLSRIEKQKGIFETIDAYKLLLNKGYHIVLSIAGDGNNYNDVLEYIAQNNLQNHINILGYVTGEQKQKALQEHDIYCLPSYSEGMPTSVLEAMAFGMPVVTTPVGGLKDFFQDEKMGYLAHSTQPEEIASCLEKLIKNKDALCDIAEYNYNYAHENFMASKVATKLKSIYDSFDL